MGVLKGWRAVLSADGRPRQTTAAALRLYSYPSRSRHLTQCAKSWQLSSYEVGVAFPRPLIWAVIGGWP